MKHEFILAVHVDALSDIQERGVVGLPSTLPFDQSKLIIAQREWLEHSDDYRQFISYTALRNARGEYFLYQRTKMAGEQKLHGKHSIGFGGHLELMDVYMNDDNGVDVECSLDMSMQRELLEETGLAVGQLVPNNGAKMEHHGWLISSRDAVDSKHIAVLNVLELSDDVIADLDFSEEDQEPIGWYLLEDIITDDLESWSEQFINRLKVLGE